MNHTKRAELVYDPFLGSGTMLAAAEVAERECCGLEIDPKYVDVIVERWEALAGGPATLDGDGRTLEELRAEPRRARGIPAASVHQGPVPVGRRRRDAPGRRCGSGAKGSGEAMKIVFLKDFKDQDGIIYRPGSVRHVPEELAKRLISEGVAEERKEVRGPEETKEGEPENDEESGEGVPV
jgi:hypothetical protein